jgi:hypothetical protein
LLRVVLLRFFGHSYAIRFLDTASISSDKIAASRSAAAFAIVGGVDGGSGDGIGNAISHAERTAWRAREKTDAKMRGISSSVPSKPSKSIAGTY